MLRVSRSGSERHHELRQCHDKARNRFSQSHFAWRSWQIPCHSTVLMSSICRECGRIERALSHTWTKRRGWTPRLYMSVSLCKKLSEN